MAQSIVETQQEVELATLRESLKQLGSEYETLSFRMEERLQGLDSMMRDELGWTSILGGSNDDGPSLDQLKKRSKQIRNGMSLNPHLHNGSELLANRVWADMPRYSGVPGLNGEPVRTGVPDIGKYVKDPVNQNYVFGAGARKERSRAQFSDGVYLLLGDNRTRRMHPIPLWELTGTYVNPENSSEVWAYRRSWDRWDSAQAKSVPEVRWYFTDLFYDKIVDTITYNGTVEQVDRGKTVIDGHVNRQVGWALGFPIAGTVVEWARKYSEFIRAGLNMSDAMARLWAQYTPATATAGANAGVKVAGQEGFGNTAVASGSWTTLATAGKSYDFGAGTQVLAIVAAGLGVSVIALSANPGDAGGSYGAAQVLSLPERLATISQRGWEAEFDMRVLRWMGARDPLVTFPPLVDGAEAYRLKQGAQLSWNSGLYEPEEAKEKFEAADGNTGALRPVPDGVLIPGNRKSLALKDIDTDGQGSVQAGSGGQGQATGTGGAVSSNDARTDTVA